MRSYQKLMACLLALVMLLSVMPLGAFAAQTTKDTLTEEERAVLTAHLGESTLDTQTSAAMEMLPEHKDAANATYSRVLPGMTMVEQTAIQGETMPMQFIFFNYGVSNQKAGVQIYYNSVTEENFVGIADNEFPTSVSTNTWTVNWDTAGDPTGTYVVVAYTSYYYGGNWYIAEETIYDINVYVTKTAAPIKALYVLDGDTDQITKEVTLSVNQTFGGYVAFDPARTTSSRALTVTSSDESVATVDNLGGMLTVRAVGSGKCDIIVSTADKSTKVKVLVPVPATDISLDRSELAMHADEKETLVATVLPENATDEVVWTTSDAKVATVADGVVTAVGGGTATVTAQAGSYSAQCEVTVTDHEFEVSEREQSCTEAGATLHTCTVCGYVKEETNGTALGHDWDEGTVVTEATETENGAMLYTCHRCQATRTKVIPATAPCNGADCPSAAFTDVPTAKNWAHAGIDFALEQKIFNGITATTFQPATALNRGMLVTVLWRIDGKPEPEGTNHFPDVKSGKYYTKAVTWANENGIVTGITPEKFAPEDPITREQIATILFRYATYKDYDVYSRADLSAFPDAGKVSKYAKQALAWANVEGLVTGTKVSGVTVLDPKGKTTRAQAATLLMRFIYNVVGTVD